MLTEADVPDSIKRGCKTPMPVIVRALVAGVTHLVLFFVAKRLVSSVSSHFKDAKAVVDTAGVLLTIAGLAALHRHLWTFLTDHLRNCGPYDTFMRYAQDNVLKGMDKTLAINEALEDLERHRQMNALRRRSRVGAFL